MNYLIAVLPDRIQAEAAYTALEKENFPVDQMSIVGQGYKTADEFGFIDPKRKFREQASFMAYWLVPFGFVGGIAFSLATGLNTFAWAGSIGNHLVGGILGAIGGAFGRFFVGGGVGLASGSGAALPYRNRLNQGKYLVVVKGQPRLTNQASKILNQFNPENIQGYVEPDAV